MKVKIFKQRTCNFLTVDDQIICAFNESKNQFIRCTTSGITDKVISCINDFRELYNLKPITVQFFLQEFSC